MLCLQNKDSVEKKRELINMDGERGEKLVVSVKQEKEELEENEPSSTTAAEQDTKR